MCVILTKLKMCWSSWSTRKKCWVVSFGLFMVSIALFEYYYPKTNHTTNSFTWLTTAAVVAVGSWILFMGLTIYMALFKKYD